MTVSLDKPLSPIQNLGRQVADEIEARGHWQGQDKTEGDDSCCVITSNAYWHNDTDFQIRFKKAVAAKAGFDWEFLFDWNDSTPTAEVLDTLRSL